MITFATQAAFDKAVQDSIAKLRMDITLSSTTIDQAYISKDVVNGIAIVVKNAAGVDVLKGTGSV
jgi:hypothetical protein